MVMRWVMKNSEMLKFVVRSGILKWGAWMYLFTVGFQLYKSYKFPGYWDKDITLASYLLMNLVIWVLAGAVMGVVFWKVNK